MIPSMVEVAAVITVTRVALSTTTTTNSTSSTMEADRVHLEVTMDNLHKEPTTPISSSTSSTMHTCSRNRLCTTTLNMRCRCSSTTPAWASSTLENPLPLLPQCTRGDLLEKSSLRSEL